MFISLLIYRTNMGSQFCLRTPPSPSHLGGYIYNRAECAGLYFEEQGPGFRCPQCSGPRRRYAKKVGDRVGTTLDGGDAPILIFSFGGVIATIAFGFWAVNNL